MNRASGPSPRHGIRSALAFGLLLHAGSAAATPPDADPAATEAWNQRDSDADGLRNGLDRCPYDAGADGSPDRDGCPDATIDPTASASGGCTDPLALASTALLGQLSRLDRDCLELRVTSERALEPRLAASRLLITNSEGKGDRAEWNRLVKRHLEALDASDPELCFKYALELSRRGVARAEDVIRWSDQALVGQAKWPETVATKRVFMLHKIRAEAANRLWVNAEQTYADDRTDESGARASRWRVTARDHAREWVAYAQAIGEDTRAPIALCASAAGERARCEPEEP